MAVVGSASDGLSALTLPALSSNLTKNSSSGNSDLDQEPVLQKGSQLEEDEDGSFILHHIHFLQQQQQQQNGPHCNGISKQKDAIANGSGSNGHENGNINVGHDGPVDEGDQLPPQHVVDAAAISDRIADNLPSEEGLTSSQHVVDAGSIADHIADSLPSPEDLTPLISEESHSIQTLGFDGNPILTVNCADVNLSNVKTLSNCPVLDDSQNGTLTNGFHLPDATGTTNAGTQKQFGTDSMLELQDLLSKLNPLAEEFVPPSLMASNGAALNPNIRRKKNNYGLGRRRGNSRVSRAQREECVRRTVYVSDIDQQVTEEQLAALFQTCGQVIDCRVCGDPNSVLRFAFVEFADEEEARMALSLSGTMLGYYPVRVLPSKTAIVPVNPTFLPHSENEREMCARTIYCTNIDKKVSQAEVKLFFESLCGEVARLRLLGDYQHSTRIAFVEFVLADSAMTALNCSGAILGSLPLRVSPSKTPVRSRSSRVPSV